MLRWSRVSLRLVLAIVPLVLVLPHALGWRESESLARFENYLYDLRVRATMPGGVDPRIVIVDIDERSLAVEGQWPWSRRKLAALVDALFDRYGARVVGFDALFAEPEENSALELIGELAADPGVAGNAAAREALLARRAAFQADERFAESFIARDVVLGFVFKQSLMRGEARETGALPPPLALSGEDLARVPWLQPAGFTGNVAVLQQNATAGGFFDTPLVDADGVVRRMPLLQRYGDGVYESLALAVARLAGGSPPIRLAFARERGGAQRLEFVAVGEVQVPVDRRGAALTPFRGPLGSFPYVSATDVLRGEARAERLTDAIVLVGASAAGLLDVRATPVGSQYIGVEAHANLVAGILDGTVIARPAWSRLWDVAILLALVAIFAFVLPGLGPLTSLLTVLGLAALITGLNALAWINAGIALPLASALVYLIAAILLLLNYAFFIESRRKRRLSRLFGQYVPPEVVTELDASDADISLEGESREMTVLFSDVRGFTTLSEGLAPRELTQLMNEMLSPLTEAIQRRRGTIDKYMGDAIMAFWGAPLPDAEHARHAVLAALDMIAETARLRREFAARGWPEVRIGVGLSTGPMNVGNMGSRFRMAYTVLGDSVNLGSRLESLTKGYGVDILVSEATASAVPEVLFRPIDLVRVKGKLEPVAIFEPIGPRDAAEAATLASVEGMTRMLATYRARDFSAAQSLLDELERSAATPMGLIALYRERLAHFKVEPPPARWDGVYVHEKK
jgi:adenylate cyclase